jgi:hypothetical protein
MLSVIVINIFKIRKGEDCNKKKSVVNSDKNLGSVVTAPFARKLIKKESYRLIRLPMKVMFLIIW